jgi:hypothetical protein
MSNEPAPGFYGFSHQSYYSTVYSFPVNATWPTVPEIFTTGPDPQDPAKLSSFSATGVFISSNLVLTAQHVANGATSISVANHGTASVLDMAGVYAALPPGSDDDFTVLNVQNGLPSNQLIGFYAADPDAASPVNLATATTVGYPGLYQYYPDVSPPFSPAASDVLYQSDLNISSIVGAPNVWHDTANAVAAGNSGGPVFVTTPTGVSRLAGIVTGISISPSTHPYLLAHLNYSYGIRFDWQMVSSLTNLIKTTDPNGGGSGWWLTQPTNMYALNDSDGLPITTDDRSDIIYTGVTGT